MLEQLHELDHLAEGVEEDGVLLAAATRKPADPRVGSAASPATRSVAHDASSAVGSTDPAHSTFAFAAALHMGHQEYSASGIQRPAGLVFAMTFF